MSTNESNISEYCGQCGWKLPIDKTCRNASCSMYGQPANLNNFSNTTTVSIGEGRPGPISQVSSNTAYPTYFTPAPTTLTAISPRSRIYLIAITVLVIMLVGAGVLVGILVGKGNSPIISSITPVSTTSNSSGPVPVNTVAETQTSATSPTSAITVTSIASATVAPPSGVLYQADWSSGMDGWAGSSEWKVVNGVLLSDGTNAGYNVAPAGSDSIISPYQPTTTNYAIVAKIQIVDTPNNCYLALRGRVQADGSGYDGYFAGYDSYFGDADIAYFSPNDGFASIKSTIFSPGLSEHTYRAEFKDNQITLKIDGNSVLQVTDNRFINTGLVGLENGGCQISVSSFQVLAL